LFDGLSHRWAESEKLTPDPAPKIKTPDPVNFQILDSGSDPCPYLFIQYIPVPEQQTCKPIN